MTIALGALVERWGGDLRGARGAGSAGSVQVADVVLDSRRAGRGALFAALPGRAHDGAGFAAEAVARGAVAVLAPAALSESILDPAVPQWIHPEARRVCGHAAHAVHGWPSKRLDVIAVTGTNGKTSVAHIARQLLVRAGRRPALVGTLGYRLEGDVFLPASHTTPEATELHRMLARHAKAGGDSVVIEVSSHALDQHRIAGVEVDVAVFTNLSRDHLDYHPDMESYAAAKARLFEGLAPGSTAVVRASDLHAERMIRAARAAGARVVTYALDDGAGEPDEGAGAALNGVAPADRNGTGPRADLCASRLRADSRGVRLFLQGMGISRTAIRLPLGGRHNVENALAALAAALATEASPASVLAGLADVTSPRGRLERVDPRDGGVRGGDGSARQRGFAVYVDYAHTEAALEGVLGGLREELAASGAPGRLLCVFGCGGDRDAGKRAPMGAVANRLADVVWVTSDNPRREDPRAIIDQILEGLRPERALVRVEPDRAAAIRGAIAEARPGDVVLIAGKGHETVQVVGTRALPFDDRLVAEEALA